MYKFKECIQQFRSWCKTLKNKNCRYIYDIKYHKYDYEKIFALLKAQKEYPKNILTVEETVNSVINNRISLSRLGDGEEFADNLLNDEPKYPLLKKKLYDICQNGSDDKCLVCINNFNVDDVSVPSFYRKAFAYYYSHCFPIERILQNIKFNKRQKYGDAYAFLFYFKDTDSEEIKLQKISKIKNIWNGKKVLFVVNEESKLLHDAFCFDNVKEKRYVFGPSAEAFKEYDRIYAEILESYDTSWLIYLALGSCATVLSYELAQKGYQSLDMGFFYDRIIVSYLKKQKKLKNKISKK